MDLVESCRKLIALDSSPDQGNALVAEFVAELCRQSGLEVETLDENLGELRQVNVLARPAGTPTNSPELMLQTHLDTPDPGPFGMWTKNGHNPFDAHIIDGCIYGLGAADVKLDFLCKLEALRRMGKVAWKIPPVLVGTFGEETGMTGTLRLIRKNKIRAKWALIGEPSDGQLITAGKGIATVEIRVPYGDDELQFRDEHNLKESSSTQSRIFNGKPAHSSTPHLGESAIMKMFEYLCQLPEDLMVMDIGGGVNFNTVPARAYLEIEQVSGHRLPMAKKLSTIYAAILELENSFLQYTDARFQPPTPTLNIGLIRNFNDHVLISGNCRITPEVGNEIYEGWMETLGQKCQRVGAELRITDYKRPFLTAVDSAFAMTCLQELKALKPQTQFVAQSSTNEASLFSRIGVECVCFGPGSREGNIHTPFESVSIDDLQTAVEFYQRVLRRFCL